MSSSASASCRPCSAACWRCLIGWLLDSWLGTGHLLLVVMMVLGTVGGFWSIIKIVEPAP